MGIFEGRDDGPFAAAGADAIGRRRVGFRSKLAVYPTVIVSANGNRTEQVVDLYAWRARQDGVLRRRSRCSVHDGRKRFRVRMRAAARCNPWAAARWEDMKQSGKKSQPIRFDRGRAMNLAIDKAAYRGRA